MSLSNLDGALQGVRVLDLTRLLPGPFATMILADLGADVIKLEDPQGGDYARYYQPFIGEMGAFFASVNRNKRSVAINLKAARGRGVLERLLANSDVLIESFRPGVMDRMGLSRQRLSADYPQMIVCSISGYGQTGPSMTEAGHDLNYLARAGLSWTTGTADGELVVPGFQLADIAGGTLYAVSAILAALFKRERGGGGSFLDISMTEGALSFNIPALGMLAAGNAPVGAAMEMLNGGIPCYSIYETEDGGHMALAALEPKFWRAFCDATGFDADGSDGHERGERGARLRAELIAHFATRTRDEWAALLEDVDCCCVAVRRAEEVSADPLFVARDIFFEIEHGDVGPVRHMATPLTPADRSTFTPPPRLGEHTEGVLTAVGVTAAELAALRNEKVII